MIRFNLFRALNPDEEYPNTLLNVSLREVKFDLPLPPTVCDALLEVLLRSGNFARIGKLCSPTGMQKIRSEPEAFDAATALPTFAGCEVIEDVTEPGLEIGYTLDMIAVNASAARKILHLAVEGGTFDEEVDVWIVNRIAYFTYCGGFEIARLLYYTDADEQAIVSNFVDSASFGDQSKSLTEKSECKPRFRDMLNA